MQASSSLALSLNTAAYTTEMLAVALRTAPHGKPEVARAAGMGPGAVPHPTSLASSVIQTKMTRMARDVYGDHSMVTEASGTVGVSPSRSCSCWSAASGRSSGATPGTCQP